LLLEQALAVESGATERDPSYGAMLGIAQGRLLLVMGNPARAIVCLSEARAFAETIQHEVVAAAAQCLLVAAYAELGNSERARACASKLTALCEPRGMRFYSERGNAFLAASHIEEHRASDAIAILHPLTEQPDRLLAASARARLALAYIAAGDWAAASLEADAAFDAGSMFPSTHHSASAALALVAIHFGRPRDALDIAERSLEQESGGVWLLDGSVLRLARVEALHALGRTGDAHVALRQARDRILNVAATLEDPELRHSYTTRVAVNARTLELAGEWLGVASS
jgi:tetratricopeptide (TPR) repeat protein